MMGKQGLVDDCISLGTIKEQKRQDGSVLVLHIDDRGLEQKIDKECQSGTYDGLRTIENYFICSSFCGYIKIYSAYERRTFAFHNDKIEKLFDILEFL